MPYHALLNLNLSCCTSSRFRQEYFLVSKTFMFLNLAGHAISFYLDAIGKKDLQKLMNKFNLWGMLLIMWLIVICRLHVACLLSAGFALQEKNINKGPCSD